MLGLGMLGNDRKSTTVVSAMGRIGGKDYEETYGEGKEMDDMDMINPVEMMMDEFIKSVHEKDSKKAAKILCFIIEIERRKGKTEIEIKA